MFVICLWWFDTILIDMEMDEVNEYEISIEDPENNQIYKVLVSLEDFQRFQTDEQFANSLLFHAKCTTRKTTNEIQSDSPTTVEDDDNENSTRMITTWSYDQTIDLINSMESHFQDFNHPRKRKHVYENVANDLCSMGYNYINPVLVQNKWKSLLRSYKKAKDTKNRTGQGPSRFHFFDKLDEILGNKPTNQCDHSLNTIETVGESSSSTLNIELHNEDTDSTNHTERDPESTNTSVKELKKQRFSEIKMQKDYIELKKQEYQDRQTRHTQRLELENKKIEIEQKKIELLEQYLKNKK